MSASGKNTKKKSTTSRGVKRKANSNVAKKTIPVKTEPQPVDPKVLEANRKKIHAAAMEAQTAVKKALDGMVDQVKYEEKYDE